MLSPAPYDALVIGAGQAGLAAAYHLQRRSLRFAVLEAGGRAAGSWPQHYDSLTLFSPARHASLPGLPFPGDPDHYPRRDEVADYLEGYARHFRFPLLGSSEVGQLLPTGRGFLVLTADGRALHARAVVAATGTYRKPFLPQLPGQDTFGGRVLHSLHYRRPQPFAGQRVVVVGAGNSAVQIAAELAQVARVSLATRSAVRFFPQRLLGRDVHDWIAWLRVDQLPLGRFGRLPSPGNVFDAGRYRQALERRQPDRRPMFRRFSARGVVWADSGEEAVDSVIFATGYRANLDFLRGTGALGAGGEPLQRLGRSLTVPGLYFAGLSGQRALASATLRGAGRDADVVVRQLERFLEKLPE